MAVADIAVVNLDVPEKAPEAPAPAAPAKPTRDFMNEDIYEPVYDHSDNLLPQERPPEEKAQAKPDEKAEPEPKEGEKPTAPETPAKPEAKHSVESIKAAADLGISAADIEDMTPKELARTVKEIYRVANIVSQQSQPKEPEKKAEAKVEYDLDANPRGYEPEVIEMMRDARQAKLEAKSAKERADSQETELKAIRLERVHARLDGHAAKLGADVSKTFDRSTAPGQKNFEKLLFRMKGLQDAERAAGNDPSEEDLFAMAARSMNVSVDKGAKQDATVEAALAAKRVEHDAGALGKVVSREQDSSVEESVRNILQRRGLPTSRKEEPTTWEP